MQLNVATTGLLNPAGLRAWTLAEQQRNQANVREGMLAAKPQLTALLRTAVKAAFTVRSKKFLNVFRARLWDRDKARFPALQLGASRAVPWIDIQETGGTIGGRMVIPLLPEGQRMGRKAFAQLLQQLTARGFIFYRKDGDRTLIFAEKPAGKDSIPGLAKFASAERARRGGKSLKRGSEVLIGVIVSRVQLRARLGFQAVAAHGAGIVAHEIQAAIERN